MSATLRRLRADFHSNRVQRVFTFLLLLLATAALTTSLSIRLRGGTAWEELYRESNGAHTWFYAEDAAHLDQIASHPGVTATSGPYPMARVTVDEIPAPGGMSGMSPDGRIIQPSGYPLWLQGIGTKEPAMGRPVLTSGRWVQADGEVVLPRRVAEEYGLRPGDTITASARETSRELRIVGLAVFAGRSPFSLPQVAWTTPGTAEPLATERPMAALGVQLESRSLTRSFVEQLERAGIVVDDPRVLFFDDWNDVRASNDEATTVVITFLGIFSVFALISASSVIVNSISARVLARYRDIGLLKAIGFTPRQVTSGLLIDQLAVAVPAVLAGIGLGLLLVPVLEDPASKEFATGSLGYFRPELLLAIAAGVLALVTLATLAPAWRAGRVPVVQAITLGPNRVSPGVSRLAEAARWLRMPAWAVTGVKDAFDRPVRSWLTIGALTLSVVTVTFVATTEWTIRQLTSRPELIGEPFEIAAETEDPARLLAAIQADPAVEAYFSRDTISVAVPGREEEVTLAALGPGFEQVDWVVWKGRLFEAPGEATVGKGFLDVTGADIGDTVELTVLGKPVRLKIVGAYRATEDDGRWALTSFETALAIDPSLEPSGYAVALKDGADAEASEALYRAAGATRTEDFDHAADGVTGVRAVLGAMAAMLLLVGLVSVVNTTASSVRERRRDLGILKAIGYTPRQAVGSVLTGALALTAIALLAGIPLGLWVSATISSQMGNELGWGPRLLEMPPVTWVLAVVPITLAAVLATAAIPASLAARLRVNEALRTE